MDLTEMRRERDSRYRTALKHLKTNKASRAARFDMKIATTLDLKIEIMTATKKEPAL